MNLFVVLVYSDQRRLAKVNLLFVGLDRSWKLEIPSLWDCVQQSVVHLVARVSSPFAGPVISSSVADGRCSGPLPYEGIEKSSCIGVEGPCGFLDVGVDQKSLLVELLPLLVSLIQGKG